ncbi:PD40 domain-containing protein [bacterium]|nr:PD40 domain-containing protein [bacterium]
MRQWQTILAGIGFGAVLIAGTVGHAAGAVDLVSARAAAGRGNGNVVAGDYKISGNGQFAVFTSYATDLVNGVADSNGTQDVFVRDLVAGTTKLVSVNSAGTASGSGYSYAPAISADGRYVAFGSYASDLVGGGLDSNGTLDVFVRDMMTGTTALVSINSAGTASGNSASPYSAISISANGRYIAFDSWASDLDGGGIDTNGTVDVFVRDMVGGTTTLASANATGTASGISYSSAPALSADGNAVAFLSYATDLTTDTDLNGNQDVFVRQLGLGITKLVSANSGGSDTGNGFSYSPAISGDGSYVAFASYADDLVSGGIDTNFSSDVFVRDVLAGTTALVSINSGGTASGNYWSPNTGNAISISADGRYVAFDSYASDLHAADTNGTVDVFVRDLAFGTTALASLNSAATASGNSFSGAPMLSADGSTVAFVSYASDLVAGGLDSNGNQDVFVRDLGTNTTKLASINHASSASGNGYSASPLAVSADGQQVLFFSYAPDLDAFGTTGAGDLFVRDDGAASTKVVNATAAGVSGNAAAAGAGVSADGRYAVFVSVASDGSPSDHNGATDVFVRDLFTGATKLVSVDASGTEPGNGASDTPTISADGRLVAFRSSASNLVSGGIDTNNTTDVFVRDLVAGTTTLVSVNSGGSASGNSSSSAPTISADGKHVAFASYAGDLVGGGLDSNGNQDVFVRDLAAGTTALVSINSAGTASGNGYSLYSRLSISANGQRVAFDSYASDLVGGGIDTNGTVDIFVRDLVAGTTTLASINAAATASGNSFSYEPALSADGSAVAFVSVASDLTADPDGNGTYDVFLRQLGPGTTKLVSVNSGGTGTGNGYSASAAVSADGRQVAFVSYANDLVSGGIDTNFSQDVFVRDVSGGTTRLVSMNSAGTASGNSYSGNAAPRISGDGQFVAFDSYASDLVAGGIDANGTLDVFLRDVVAGTTVLASLNGSGTASANGQSREPVMSPSGLFVIFNSDATDLVLNDRNGRQDVFRFTGELCAAAPRPSCKQPAVSAKALLQLKKNLDSGKDKLGWKWLKGDVTPLAEFGDPLTETSYALCVYDRTAGVPALKLNLVAPAGDTCGANPCWKAVGGGFAYKDKAATNDGLSKMLLKEGATPGKAKILVLGRGAGLGMPAPVGPGLLAQDTSATAQLVNSAGACWGAEFSAPATKNSAAAFKDKAD